MQAGISFSDARDTPVRYLERLAERVAPRAYRSTDTP